MPSFEMGGLNGVLLEGLKKAIDHWGILAWPRFTPASPKLDTSALSTFFNFQLQITA
jgi:hypothetical protein